MKVKTIIGVVIGIVLMAASSFSIPCSPYPECLFTPEPDDYLPHGKIQHAPNWPCEPYPECCAYDETKGNLC